MKKTEIESLDGFLTEARWIPVTDKLPKLDESDDSDVVLVCGENGWIGMAIYMGDIKEWSLTDHNSRSEIDWENIVAWMPLPKPYSKN